jgi:hypothetical protein
VSDVEFESIVTYSLKARTVDSLQPAVTRQRPGYNNRGMVFSTRSVPMAAYATMEYVMPPLSNDRTATKERCFLRDPCRDVIRGKIYEESVGGVELVS